MLKSVPRSSTRWLLLPSAILAAGVLLAPFQAAAEIILDDFDEPFDFTLPEDLKFDYLVQPGVGPLNAERQTHVVATYSTPTGRADANFSRASSLTFDVDRLNPTTHDNLILVEAHSWYYFDEIDATQLGLNDRVVIDFGYLRSALPLARVDVFINDRSQSGDTKVSQLFDIAPQDEPFRLEFPFDSFGSRGGGASNLNFRRVFRVGVSIYPVWTFSFSGPNDIGFSTAVERIRFTIAIPEPATSVLGGICAISATLSLSRRRRRWSHAEEDHPRVGRNGGCSPG